MLKEKQERVHYEVTSRLLPPWEPSPLLPVACQGRVGPTSSTPQAPHSANTTLVTPVEGLTAQPHHTELPGVLVCESLPLSSRVLYGVGVGRFAGSDVESSPIEISPMSEHLGLIWYADVDFALHFLKNFLLQRYFDKRMGLEVFMQNRASFHL